LPASTQQITLRSPRRHPGPILSSPASADCSISSQALIPGEWEGPGPPYNNQTANAQRLLFAPAANAGARQPVNAAQDFVTGPLAQHAPTDPAIAAPLPRYRAATAAQQLTWANAYATAVAKVKFVNGTPVVPAANDGRLPALMTGELTLARSGALDTDLLAQQPFYGTNFTKPLLFTEDGAYFVTKATAMGLSGR